MTDNSPKAIVLRMLDQRMLDMLHGTTEFLDSFAEAAVWEYAPTSEAPRWRRVEGKDARRAVHHRA